MSKLSFIKFIALVLFLVCAHSISAQTSAFTYQGKLNEDGVAPSGTYQLQFRLYDAPSGGNQIGQSLTDISVTVTNGVFAVSLDFGVNSFDGSNRYLEVAVRPNGSPDPYTILNPRHAITSTPYAIRSFQAEQADSANLANIANTANNATNLGSVPASQYVQTNDSRMSDARSPLPGSTNYIQNSQNQQSSSNFNISGEGKANKFNAATQYDINGNRVLSVKGTDNVIVGVDAGQVTTGGYNAFVGKESGKSNTTGLNNSFLGAYSGRGNTIGNNNAFVGANSGLSNNAGSSNAFFGSNAGFSNTSGSSNSFFGFSAGKSVTNAGSNAFFGSLAGENTTTGGNSYFGAFTGQKNTTGFNNSFFGLNAGKENLGGSNNTYLGANTGQMTGAVGSNNTFIGSNAGQVGSLGGAVNGSNNIAIGYNAKIHGGINNATAIGANALAVENNSIALGTFSTKVSVPGEINVAKKAVFEDSLKVTYKISGGDLDIGNGMLVTVFENGFNKLKMKGIIEASIQGGDISGNQGYFDGYVRAEGFSWRKFPSVGAANQKACYYQNQSGITLLAPCSSSIRYKENVQSFTSGLDLLNRLRPVTYSWKLNGQKDLGFIAEEVNEIEPLLSSYNEKGEIEGVRYELLTTVLVNSIKEQQEQIKRQQEQIEALKALVCGKNKNAAVCKN